MTTSWGAQLGAAREAADLSQTELAKLWKTSQPAISRWEQGAQCYNDRILKRIAEFIGRDYKELRSERGRDRRTGGGVLAERVSELEAELARLRELLEAQQEDR